MITLDAGMLARGWLSVATAASTKADEAKHRPQLHRTVQIAQHTHGLRLAATDSYMILTAWVPEKDYELDEEPGLDEVPYATAVAIDEYGRGASLLAHLLSLSQSDDHKGLEVNVQLNVPWQPDEIEGADRQLDGFEALAVTVEHPDSERVQLGVHEGAYPHWQHILTRRTGRGGQVALSQWMMGRLAKAARPHGELTAVRCWVGGKDKPLTVAFGSEPGDHGDDHGCPLGFGQRPAVPRRGECG
jgi:hypothetical protein